jgi:hypothetical protein
VVGGSAGVGFIDAETAFSIEAFFARCDPVTGHVCGTRHSGCNVATASLPDQAVRRTAEPSMNLKTELVIAGALNGEL